MMTSAQVADAHIVNMPVEATAAGAMMGMGGGTGPGKLPPVAPDITDRIFGHCCPARWKASGWWTPSYIADYLLLVLLWIGVGICWFWYDEDVKEYFVPPPNPNGPGFAWYDNKYTYPHKKDSISPGASVVLSFIAPAIVMLVFAIVRRSAHDFHNAMLGMGEAIGFGYIIQIPLTRAVGAFRPDYLSRVIKGDPDEISDGRRSFPSGHATIAFAGYGFLCFYLIGKTKVFHAAYGNLWRLFVVLAPVAAAVAQAVSRIHDNRHSNLDVFAGAYIGLCVAIFGYYANFPGPFNRFSSRPKNRKARLNGDFGGLLVDY
jgi:membrane-associated phospholipid phosphatase